MGHTGHPPASEASFPASFPPAPPLHSSCAVLLAAPGPRQAHAYPRAFALAAPASQIALPPSDVSAPASSSLLPRGTCLFSREASLKHPHPRTLAPARH